MKVSPAAIRRFRTLVYRHYRAAGRHGLPWRKTNDAYRIFVSEIMLQQTQVSRVLPKYRGFLRVFPGFHALAKASPGEVLRAWQGLGYNRRALHLHRAARAVIRDHGGCLPESEEALRRLPGVGPGTVGSLRAFAFDLPAVFVETNIRRAIIQHFFPQRASVSEKDVRAAAEAVVDTKRPRAWYSALMDYGAMLGATLPKRANANRRSALYAKQSRFAGSDRELRGRILRRVLRVPVSAGGLAREMGGDPGRVRRIAAALIAEGFLERARGKLRVARRR